MIKFIKKHKKIFLVLISFQVVAAVVISIAGLITAEHFTSKPDFCGSCHIMDKYYDTWKKSKHGEKDVACIQCHYAPGEHKTLKAKFKGLGQLFSYLGAGEKEVHKAAFVNDQSCTVSECHPITGPGSKGGFWEKQLDFYQYTRHDSSKVNVKFTHGTHFKKKSWMVGQEKHCSICHRRQTSENHMEVSQNICNLCHFKNLDQNKDRSKCSLCHEIPQKPVGGGGGVGGRLVTHQQFEKNNIDCASCHLHNIKGNGKVDKEKCLICHENNQDLMKFSNNTEIMHQEHVTKQKAPCFSCHETIQHGHIKDWNYAEATLGDCGKCHPEPHKYKKLILAGEGGIGAGKPMPIKHHEVNLSCLGCHQKDTYSWKGQKIKKAPPKACAACHTKKEGELIAKWKSDVAEMLEEALDAEKDALKTIANAKGKAPAKNIKAAKALVRKARANLKIVKAGGGVHNKKYSILLLDIAIENFEDAVSKLE